MALASAENPFGPLQPGFEIAESAQFEAVILEGIVLEQAAILDRSHFASEDLADIVSGQRAILHHALRNNLPRLMQRQTLERPEDGIGVLGGHRWARGMWLRRRMQYAVHNGRGPRRAGSRSK